MVVVVVVEVCALILSIWDPLFLGDIFSTGSSFPVFYPVNNESFWVERVYQYIAAHCASSVQGWMESGRPEAGLLVVVGEGRPVGVQTSTVCRGKEAVNMPGKAGGAAGAGGHSYTSSARFSNCNFCAFLTVGHLLSMIRLFTCNLLRGPRQYGW